MSIVGYYSTLSHDCGYGRTKYIVNGVEYNDAEWAEMGRHNDIIGLLRDIKTAIAKAAPKPAVNRPVRAPLRKR